MPSGRHLTHFAVLLCAGCLERQSMGEADDLVPIGVESEDDNGEGAAVGAQPIRWKSGSSAGHACAVRGPGDVARPRCYRCAEMTARAGR